MFTARDYIKPALLPQPVPSFCLHTQFRSRQGSLVIYSRGLYILLSHNFIFHPPLRLGFPTTTPILPVSAASKVVDILIRFMKGRYILSAKPRLPGEVVLGKPHIHTFPKINLLPASLEAGSQRRLLTKVAKLQPHRRKELKTAGI